MVAVHGSTKKKKKKIQNVNLKNPKGNSNDAIGIFYSL